MFVWFASFGLSLHLQSGVDVPVMLGSVSYPSNPFWSQRVPGLQFCPTNSLPISHSYQERKLVLPLNESGRPYDHCRIRLDRSDAEIYERVMRSDLFLRFYVGLTTVRCACTRGPDHGSSSVQIATHFTIRIDNSRAVQAPRVAVVPDSFVVPEMLIFVNYSFSVELEAFPADDGPPQNHFLLVLFGVLLIVTALIVSVVFIWRHRTNRGVLVPVREIWRLQESFQNMLLFTGAGMAYTVVGVVIWASCPGRRPIGPFLGKAMVIAAIPAAQLTALIARAVTVILEDPTIVTPVFWYYLSVCTPLHLFSVVFGFFGSFRGYRIRQIMVVEPILIVVAVEVARGFGYSTRFFDVPPVAHPQIGPSVFPLRPLGFAARGLDVLHVIIGAIMVVPLCDSLIGVLCDDDPVDVGLMAATFLLYGGAAALAGLLRTIHRLTVVTQHWTDDHIEIHCVTGCVAMAYVALRGILRYGVRELKLQVLAAFGVLVWEVGAAVIAIGVFFSYVWSFVVVALTFGGERTT
jgi:hypothetical protein